MRNTRRREGIRRCLYAYNSDVIQLNVECESLQSNSETPWALLVDHSSVESEDAQNSPVALKKVTITCALHPTLSAHDGISWTLKCAKLKYLDSVHFVYPESQFCIDSAFVYCNLPHLYPTTSSEIDTSETENSWRIYDALISLLQDHFRFCKTIVLVLRTNRDSWRKQPPRHDMMARVEKVLSRADELYRVLAQQGCDFTIHPSSKAFRIYLDRAKETGGIFKEGNWDLRDGDSHVWRNVEMSGTANSLEVMKTEKQSGYWVREHCIDWLEWEELQYV